MPIDSWVKRSVPRYRAKRVNRTYRKKASSRRRSSGRTRYRKRRGGMSQKRVLNLTSRKKRDTMQYYTNNTVDTPNPGGEVYTAAPTVVVGGSGRAQCFIFCPTAREFSSSLAGLPAIISDVASRTATTCYMRGLSERIELQVSDGLPWQWRRICFTAKGFQTQLTTGPGFSLYSETSAGYVRLMNQIDGTNQTAMENLLFRGQAGVDWLDPISAPTDNSRLTIKYDKTITIASGNEDGVIRKYNRWMPMNHNLVYDDDETGGSEAASHFSVVGKAGMGDYYIVDYFRPRVGSSSENRLLFAPQATLYWHEK